MCTELADIRLPYALNEALLNGSDGCFLKPTALVLAGTAKLAPAVYSTVGFEGKETKYSLLVKFHIDDL